MKLAIDTLETIRQRKQAALEDNERKLKEALEAVMKLEGFIATFKQEVADLAVGINALKLIK